MVETIGQSRRGSGPGRPFLSLWAASIASNLGDGVWLIAAPLLAASLTRDPTLVAGLAFAQRLPWLLLGLLGGALADRLDRRRAMIAVAICRAALVAALGLAVMGDWANMPLLYVIFFLIATGETLFDTSASAILPSIVNPPDLPKANARLFGTTTVTNQFIGPPLGGLLFAVTRSLPFLLGAGGLVIAAGLLTRLRGNFKPERGAGNTQRNIWGEIGEGLRWLWSQRLLRTLSISLGLLNLTLVAQVSIMVLFAEERLNVGPGGYGLLIAIYGVGGVIGSLVTERVLKAISESRYLRLAIVIEAAAPAAIAISRSPIAVGAVLLLFGMHAVVWGAILTSLRQELTPDRLRGRVGSVHSLIEYGTAAPGALLGGLLASRFGLTAPFWLGAAVGVTLLPFVWSRLSASEIAEARRTATPGTP